MKNFLHYTCQVQQNSWLITLYFHLIERQSEYYRAREKRPTFIPACHTRNEPFQISYLLYTTFVKDILLFCLSNVSSFITFSIYLMYVRSSIYEQRKYSENGFFSHKITIVAISVRCLTIVRYSSDAGKGAIPSHAAWNFREWKNPNMKIIIDKDSIKFHSSIGFQYFHSCWEKNPKLWNFAINDERNFETI